MTSSAHVRRARRALELLLVLACFALCLSGPRVAHAQSGASTSGAGSDNYKTLIEQALLEFRHKNWPEARILFKRAHEISPSARTLRGMGVVSYEMRDYVQAVRDLSAALSDARQPLSNDQRTEAETLLSRARTFVAVYSVRVDPETATLALDGSPLLRESDGSVILSFGEHTLTGSLDGYEPARTQVSVQGGERGEVTLTLVPQFVEPKAVAAAAEPSEPSETQPTTTNVPVVEPEPRGGLRYTWVALGSGVVFGGASAAFWFLGQQKLDDLDAKCVKAADQGSPCTEQNTDTKDIETFELMTNISLGLTGAAVVATGILAIVEWPSSGERRVALGVGPTSLSVRGAF